MNCVSIIIPVLNSPLIGTVCCGLMEQLRDDDNAEIVIVGVDDHNLIPEDARIRFIATDRLTNAAVKRNIGMIKAKGELFLFLDSDCLPKAGWIQEHLVRHAAGETVVGGAISFGRQNYFQSADNVSAFHDLLPHTPRGSRPYLATANLSVRRGVVDEVGLMEPTLDRAHDLDWTVRMRAQGHNLYFQPSAIVHHDPPRRHFAAVWRHWTEDAPDTLRVRQRYPELLATPKLAYRRWPFLWLSPLVAAWATARTFADRRTSASLWPTLPLVYLTKLAWCWSAYRHYPQKSNYRVTA